MVFTKMFAVLLIAVMCYAESIKPSENISVMIEELYEKLSNKDAPASTCSDNPPPEKPKQQLETPETLDDPLLENLSKDKSIQKRSTNALLCRFSVPSLQPSSDGRQQPTQQPLGPTPPVGSFPPNGNPPQGGPGTRSGPGSHYMCFTIPQALSDTLQQLRLSATPFQSDQCGQSFPTNDALRANTFNPDRLNSPPTGPSGFPSGQQSTGPNSSPPNFNFVANSNQFTNGNPNQRTSNGNPNQFTNNGNPNQFTNNGNPNQFTNNGNPNQLTNNGNPNQFTNNGNPNQFTNNGNPNQLANGNANQLSNPFQNQFNGFGSGTNFVSPSSTNQFQPTPGANSQLSSFSPSGFPNSFTGSNFNPFSLLNPGRQNNFISFNGGRGFNSLGNSPKFAGLAFQNQNGNFGVSSAWPILVPKQQSLISGKGNPLSSSLTTTRIRFTNGQC